ncbi:MAG: glycosyltransferase family 2 protein [Planctomycetaceae bacterium]
MNTADDAALTAATESVSVIIPVCNEQDSLEELIRQIEAGVGAACVQWEAILIDDGSTDRSWSIIERLSTAMPNVHGICFRRNFGKAAALTAGMNRATGQLLLMMDADLQDDPAEFPDMLKKLNSGFDVVNGWKQRRLDPWHKVYPSRVFNWMVSSLTGLSLHDHNCGLKLFRAEVAREIRLYGELHRFIPVLAFARGFRVTEVPVHHRPREFGYSKYGVRRFLRGLLDLVTVKFLTSFGRRPLHALGGTGLAFLAVGLVGLGWLGLKWLLVRTGLVPPETIGQRPLLAYSAASTLLGAQILSLGLIAELIIANSQQPQECFSIRQQTDQPHDNRSE